MAMIKFKVCQIQIIHVEICFLFKRRRVAYKDGVVGWLVGLQNILKILEISVVRVFMPLEVALVGHFVCMTRR